MGDIALKRDEQGRPVADSRDVAERFGKLHKDVLRAMDDLDCSPEFIGRNFAPNEYRAKNGRMVRHVLMTRDGFSFLAMGFTGAEAAKWKEKYIQAFNWMERQLADGDGAVGRAMEILAQTQRDIREQTVTGFSHVNGRIDDVETKVDALHVDVRRISSTKRRRFTKKARHAMAETVMRFYGGNCPLLGAEVVIANESGVLDIGTDGKRPEYDHFESVSRADERSGWLISARAHRMLTDGKISRTEALTYFQTYQAYMRRLGTKDLFE